MRSESALTRNSDPMKRVRLSAGSDSQYRPGTKRRICGERPIRSGCTLAAAIAATIANGVPVAEAVHDAQEYTWKTLSFGYRPGMGQHIPDRLFWAREEGVQDEQKAG